jgi:Na+/proline symporter
MIPLYDKIIIAFYIVFILTIGLIFRRLSKNTSDYFRCGGAMPWWITGTSAWLATFSAWAFTGAAGKVYQSGTIVFIVFYASIPATLFIFLYTGVRFRRMRVITYVEAVLQRYGRTTQQFYTWIRLALLLFFSGVGINSIGVFISAVFHIPVNSSLIILGTTVTIVALIGGAWAILASDFVQMLLVMTITIVTSFLALHQPQVHGLSGLIHQAPQNYFNWSDSSRPTVLLLFIFGFGLLKFFDLNQMEGSVMYLMAKSDKDARRMALIPLIGGIVGPIFWVIPAMTAHITHPNLAVEYHSVLPSHESEAAFVAVSRDVMPNGMIALLMCAMFGATLTSTDAGLNKGAGVFVRNFYHPILAPSSSEKHLLVVSKICTGVFGAIIIAISLLVNDYRTAGLFDLSNKLAAMFLFPLVIPLFYGLFFRRTPAWSGWTTSLVGFAVSFLITFCITPDRCMGWFGVHPPLNPEESGGEFRTFAPVFADLVVCSVWFFGTTLFYNPTSSTSRASNEFFKNLATPIDPIRDNIADYDTAIYRLIGTLCLVYGGFVLILMAIPQSTPQSRLCFLFIGGTIFALGWLLYSFSRRSKSANPKEHSESELVATIAGSPPANRG